jgi:hypothetical protein
MAIFGADATVGEDLAWLNEWRSETNSDVSLEPSLFRPLIA